MTFNIFSNSFFFPFPIYKNRCFTIVVEILVSSLADFNGQ